MRAYYIFFRAYYLRNKKKGQNFMKKLLILCLAASLLLASCGRKNEDTNGTESDSGNTGIEDTVGTETDTESNTESDTQSNTESDTIGDDTVSSPVTKVESAEDAIAFIDTNVYGKCQDYLPMMVMTSALSFEDMDAITYNTGLTDTTGITDIILSESGIGSFAYSFIMLRTDGSNTADIQTSLGESVNPSKWICVTAEKVSSIVLDNDIILVMGSTAQVDAIMTAVTEAADGVYENIGSVVNVLG